MEQKQATQSKKRARPPLKTYSFQWSAKKKKGPFKGWIFGGQIESKGSTREKARERLLKKDKIHGCENFSLNDGYEVVPYRPKRRSLRQLPYVFPHNRGN